MNASKLFTETRTDTINMRNKCMYLGNFEFICSEEIFTHSIYRIGICRIIQQVMSEVE